MAPKNLHPALEGFDRLPDSALIDVRILAMLLSCSGNTVWRRAKSGILPQPIRVSPQQTRWNVGEVRKSLAVILSTHKSSLVA